MANERNSSKRGLFIALGCGCLLILAILAILGIGGLFLFTEISSSPVQSPDVYML